MVGILQFKLSRETVFFPLCSIALERAVMEELLNNKIHNDNAGDFMGQKKKKNTGLFDVEKKQTDESRLSAVFLNGYTFKSESMIYGNKHLEQRVSASGSMFKGLNTNDSTASFVQIFCRSESRGGTKAIHSFHLPQFTSE